jgi:signal transduction histidine kinase
MTSISRMKFSTEKYSAAASIFVLAAMLVALGWLQYRSTQRVTEATAHNMEEGLQSSLFDFRQALERELTHLCVDLQAGDRSASFGPAEVASRLAEWQRSGPHAALATEVIFWDSEATEPVSISAGGYRKVSWPSQLSGMPVELKALFSDGGMPPAMSPGVPRREDKSMGPEPHFDWMLDMQQLALVHPVPFAGRSAARLVWLIVPLDRAFLAQHLLPELALHEFARYGQNYDVAIVLNGAAPTVLYSSQSEFGAKPNFGFDASLNLFGPPELIRGMFLSHTPGMVFPVMTEASRDTPHIFIVPLVPSGPKLMLIVRHREGSIEAAVSSLRERNLALNFGILAILAITLTLILLNSQRARSLAQMQMDFVAGISHELRTPLTAILLAARNLEDGVVPEDALARYGAAIKGQAAQLSGLVDEILLFSETHSGHHVYKFEAVDVALAIQNTLESLAPLIESSGFAIEEKISSDLPLVWADSAALGQCLQNLISNSLKYGGQKQWAMVRALVVEKSGRREVCVSVEDRGVGIAKSELKQIFEPFYRSPGVASQVHGNGLGLPLAKMMVEAMGGQLTVSSDPGCGSTFTIHLQLAEEAVSGSGVVAAAPFKFQVQML